MQITDHGTSGLAGRTPTGSISGGLGNGWVWNGVEWWGVEGMAGRSREEWWGHDWVGKEAEQGMVSSGTCES